MSAETTSGTIGNPVSVFARTYHDENYLYLNIELLNDYGITLALPLRPEDRDGLRDLRVNHRDASTAVSLWVRDSQFPFDGEYSLERFRDWIEMALCQRVPALDP